MPFSLQEFKSRVQSVYHHDAHGTSWHMHTTSKIRVYNFSWTKSLLWTIRGQRQDADCWYFCLFKLFTHSETTLILVCGMLAVGVCRAVWRTDGMSQKPVQKHTTRLLRFRFFSFFFFFFFFTSPLNCEIHCSYFCHTSDRSLSLIFVLSFCLTSVYSVQYGNHRREQAKDTILV